MKRIPNRPDQRTDRPPLGQHHVIPLAAGSLQRPVSRRNKEEDTMLSELSTTQLPNARGDTFAVSINEMLDTGALPGSKEKGLKRTTHARVRKMAAYMSLDHTSLAETKGFRIRAAYRMVFYMAWVTGDLRGPALLTSVLQNGRQSPDTHPFRPPNKAMMPGTKFIADVWEQMRNVREEYTLDDGPVLFGGMTYLPPPPPDSAWPEGRESTLPYLRMEEPPDTYDPEQDELLTLWLDAYAFLADMLRLPEGSELEPEAGVFGTMGMFSAETARFLWPTKDELLVYELELMLHIFDILTKRSRRSVERQIEKELGYTRSESIMLCKNALRCGDAVYGDDVVASKTREFMSLEEISDTAGQGEDPRAQIAARKQLQLLAGFVRTDKGRDMEDFRDLASRALNESVNPYDDPQLE